GIRDKLVTGVQTCALPILLNLETIGGRVIDAHLRFADQWPDLYGAGWLPAVVGLYGQGEWRYADRDRSNGYSVALFGPHGREYQHPPASVVEQVRRMPDVSRDRKSDVEGKSGVDR